MTTVLMAGATSKEVEWQNIKVGDVVKVEKDKEFPADLLLL